MTDTDDKETPQNPLDCLPRLMRCVGGLTEEQTLLIAEMAKAGMGPEEMAEALGLQPDAAYLFRIMAAFPKADISRHIRQARALGRLIPQITLSALAASGDLDAAKTLSAIQAGNETRNLMTNMDDDEYEYT